jgi:integrase
MSIKIRPFKKKGAIRGLEYFIRIRRQTGELVEERRKSPFTTKDATRRYAEERQAYLLQHGQKEPEPPEPPKEVPKFKDFAPEWHTSHCKANKLKHSTTVSYEAILQKHLYPFFGEKRLDQIDTMDVQKFKGRICKRSPKTINNILSVLSRLLRSAVKWKVIEKMPEIDLVKAPQKEMGFYDEIDFKRMVEAAKEIAEHGTRLRRPDRRPLLAVLMGGDAGLRCGEMLALRWGDIDWGRKMLVIRKTTWRGVTGTPKSNKERRVEMTERLCEALKAHKHLGEQVLLNDDGLPPTQQALSRWIENVERQAKMPITGRIHILRHTFCTRLAAASATIMEIKELAGHSTIQTTMKYMHLSPSSRRKAIQRLELLDESQVGDILETGVVMLETNRKVGGK